MFSDYDETDSVADENFPRYASVPSCDCVVTGIFQHVFEKDEPFRVGIENEDFLSLWSRRGAPQLAFCTLQRESSNEVCFDGSARSLFVGFRQVALGDERTRSHPYAFKILYMAHLGVPL